MAALPIALSTGKSFRLDQLATVRETIAERTQTALLDGKTVLGFSMYRAKGADETVIAAKLDATLKKLQQADDTLGFTLIAGTVQYTHDQFEGSMDMLYEGSLLAVLVVWWFLRDWRATPL